MQVAGEVLPGRPLFPRDHSQSLSRGSDSALHMGLNNGQGADRCLPGTGRCELRSDNGNGDAGKPSSPEPARSEDQQSETDAVDVTINAVDTPPAHDFAFYEWDFDEKEETAPGVSAGGGHNGSDRASGSVRTLPESPGTRFSLPTEEATPSEGLPHGASIEDLMQPSIYKSQLSRELGTNATAGLDSRLFRDVPTDSSTYSRHQTWPAGSQALDYMSPARLFSRRRDRRYSGDASTFPTEPPLPSRSARRSRTVDYPPSSARFERPSTDDEKSANARARYRSTGSTMSVKGILDRIGLKKKPQ